jgi:hypothetical protein
MVHFLFSFEKNNTFFSFCKLKVSRKRGCMPAETFVRIWKFIARPNLCETPACVKPPQR